MIKKLRKLSNMSLLCVTENNELRQSIESTLNNCKELTFTDAEGFKTLDKKFDILVVDYICNNALEVLHRVKIDNPLLPKIVILDDDKEDNIVECINASAYSILKSPVNLDDLKLSIIMALNQTKRSDKILLSEGIYYDAYRERFYDKKGAVSFTKLEYQLLKLLLDNHDRITSYEEIKEKVWKGKKMSIFTMRNVVNKIRNKTYYSIIKNNSSKGYQIDTPN